MCTLGADVREVLGGASGRVSLWGRDTGSSECFQWVYWEVCVPFQGDPGESASPHRDRDRLFTRHVGVLLEGVGQGSGEIADPSPTSPQFTPWTGSWCSGCYWFALARTCGRCPDCAPGSCLSAGGYGESATRVRGTGDTGVWDGAAGNAGMGARGILGYRIRMLGSLGSGLGQGH